MQTTFATTINHDVDVRLDAAMRSSIEEMTSVSPFLASMCGYHLGWLDRDFEHVDPSLIDKGKRIRPKIALLSSMAVSGDLDLAMPLAASIELLHNFTLIHDDIQDASPLRRHRETVWSLWGAGQAINAGDAMFAASHRLLFSAVDDGVPPETVLRLANAFDRMTIDIVGGQVMDLQFESGEPASVEAYLRMIGRKTAAIIEYAAWAGATAGGATHDQAELLGSFGMALGIGFQIQDDVLGIWGKPSETGKAEADDIRRRKQSLPIVLLRESASKSELAVLNAMYSKQDVIDEDVAAVLHMLDAHGIRDRADEFVREYHDRAAQALDNVDPVASPDAIEALRDLVAALSTRSH
jgi:geranylgeranyl diphosphate synthase type I